ncbi:hypothetical protein PV10_07880 [Exophiala mesophila]|uniref:Uncharacterized protein n=1 Tax=Exophiala mesophila TaxID=212818 RepID=A0A0D1WNJ7_EXOME|nr:uncharacterized protein PV10_07880 [Exophiala mesophila]KIV90595.1 hypothetical protein PV10_07880 [Exophiala mesophila]
MYRNTSQINCLTKPPFPSPEHTSDSESDIIDTLDRKRRQLDDEILKFKALKDREFRDFEKDLRTNRHRVRASISCDCEPSPTKQPIPASASNSALNLLASSQNSFSNGRLGQKFKKSPDSVSEKIVKPAPLSRPTLSLDRLTIAGETTPLASTFGSPPSTPLSLVRHTSPSSTTTSPGLTTPTKERTSPSQAKGLAPSAPASERSDSFAGVFTPTYLPLLDSHDRRSSVQSPQPVTQKQEEEPQQLHLNEQSKRAATQNTPSQSLPPQPVSPTVLTTKRTRSTPELPSTSLPSALRTHRGSSARKRKHVLFQLPDSAIVQPSSSYEEGPSPDFRIQDEVSLGDNLAEVGTDNGDSDSRSGRSRSGRHTTSNDRSPKAGASRSGADKPNSKFGLKPDSLTSVKSRRLRSPAMSPLPSPSPSPSPVINGVPASTGDDSGFAGALLASDDGGSGVGFFELDEELASPAFTEDRSFEAILVQGQQTDAEEDEPTDGDPIHDTHRVSNSRFYGQAPDETDEKGGRGRRRASPRRSRASPNDDMTGDQDVDGRGGCVDPTDDMTTGSFTSGSVPINIVRPMSGSWIGSVGH